VAQKKTVSEKKVSNTLQGSAATILRPGGIFNDVFVTNFLLTPKAKEF